MNKHLGLVFFIACSISVAINHGKSKVRGTEPLKLSTNELEEMLISVVRFPLGVLEALKKSANASANSCICNIFDLYYVGQYITAFQLFNGLQKTTRIMV